jgi:hypothetical protein
MTLVAMLAVMFWLNWQLAAGGAGHAAAAAGRDLLAEPARQGGSCASSAATKGAWPRA